MYLFIYVYDKNISVILSIVQGVLDIHAVSNAELHVDSKLAYQVRFRHNKINLN